MRNKSQLLLIVAVFWVLCAVFSSNIFARVVDISLAISCFSSYVGGHFPTTSTQKIWIHRFEIVSLATAGIFLILEVYDMFFA